MSPEQVQAGEVTKSAHPARFSPDDKYSSKGTFSIIASGEEREADCGGFQGTESLLRNAMGCF